MCEDDRGMNAHISSADFTVSVGSGGERLDRFLSRAVGNLSRSQVQKRIIEGAVLVNGQPARKNYLVAEGDYIRTSDLNLLDRPVELEPQNLPLSILYEDDYFLAVNKSAGLVIHPGNGNCTGTLVNALLYHLGKNLSEGSHPERPGIVHRLDKDTSGVLLIAKTNSAHVMLAHAFASRLIKKDYLGFCMGIPSESAGIIDIPLARSRKDPIKRAPDRFGKFSRTEFRLLSTRSGISLVQFMPQTGRTHQIRVHCSSKGFPVLGDTLYGGGSGRLPQLAPAYRPFAILMLACFGRQALHAWRIGFTHPFLKKEIVVTAPLPDDFRKGLQAMGENDRSLQFF
jgi:23S rRNA pseudouridine1911/1915/1917 synthase